MAPASKLDTPGLKSDLEKASEDLRTYTEEVRELDSDVDRQLKREDLQTKKEYNRTLAQNNVERKKYAQWIFALTCIWGTLIFVILFFLGFGAMKLSDPVVITLISSTTVNFFGFFLLVVKYLFRDEGFRLEN